LSSLGAGSGWVAVSWWRVSVAARRTAAFALVMTLMSLLSCGSAWGTTGHNFAGQFGGFGNGDGQFSSGPTGVAVMPSTGDVFVADQGAPASGAVPTPRVERFDAGGAFQSAVTIGGGYTVVSSVAVDPAGLGSVYALAYLGGTGASVLKYSVSGALVYQLDASTSGTTIAFAGGGVGGNAALAVDPVDGTVYVAATDNGNNAVIDSFDPATGAFIASFDGSNGSPDGGFRCPNGLAVDGTHHVYVLDTCKNRVDQYSAAGAYLNPVDVGSRVLSAVAADASSGEVYVSEAGQLGLQVAHFSAGGAALVYVFDASNVASVGAIAVGAGGTVYVADSTNPVVERFTRFDGPTVVTGSTSPPEARAVTLEGTIDPEGVASSYHFEYGTGVAYGSRTDETSAGSGTGAVAASAALAGLRPNTAYHYRIVGSNAAGSIAGDDASFVTGSAPADIGPAFASGITPRSARIHGSVNPNSVNLSNSSGFTATYSFEYGTSTAYGQTAVGGNGGTLCLLFVGCPGSALPVDASLSALEPGTTYHFRVVADNGTGGVQLGADQTFITAPAAAGTAGDVTTKRATLMGTINPHGTATTYHFNYGPSASYGETTPEADGGAADGDRLVTQQISGLLPSTVYHVQVVATTGDVTRFGGDGLFRTPPAPTATAIGPTGVSTSAATLAGDVNTYGSAGTYRFDVSSLDSSYVSSTGERAVSGVAAVERVTAPIDGLPAGETFIVQLTVTSNESSQVSDLVTFATASVPRVFPPPPASDGSSLYGCSAPHLDAFNARPKPGDTIAITGHDLGVGGNAVLGDGSLTATDWSATGFRVRVPDDATGTVALTVDCGHRSNTIAIAIFHQPDNAFSITGRSVTRSTVTLTVKAPGPGKFEISGTNAKPAKTIVSKAGAATIKITLTSAGVRALARAKSHTLKVTAHVRFTPAGGTRASKTATFTFKRKAGR
jgi:hypothetical protein